MTARQGVMADFRQFAREVIELVTGLEPGGEGAHLRDLSMRSRYGSRISTCTTITL